jgi:hypothetical protein
MDYMLNYVVKCVACNGLSYEVENEEHRDYTYLSYKCSECDSEWEVIACAK